MLSRPSALVLILANLLPLAGVLWLDWSVLEILLLYWTESVIIGAVNVLRMASCSAAGALPGVRGAGHGTGMAAARAAAGAALPASGMKLLLIPFFILHFGMFCFGHLSAVVFLLGTPSGSTEMLSALPPTSEPMFWVAVGAIALSHLFSFFVNFLGGGEYRRVSLSELMRRPYGRIAVMHITIVAGAAAVDRLESPLSLLLVLILVKTGFDLFLHAKERETFMPTGTAAHSG